MGSLWVPIYTVRIRVHLWFVNSPPATYVCKYVIHTYVTLCSTQVCSRCMSRCAHDVCLYIYGSCICRYTKRIELFCGYRGLFFGFKGLFCGSIPRSRRRFAEYIYMVLVSVDIEFVGRLPCHIYLCGFALHRSLPCYIYVCEFVIHRCISHGTTQVCSLCMSLHI